MEEMNNASISQILVEAMKSRGMSVEKLARETGISERFIQLLLEEKFEKLPASPYLHGYVLKIADELDMDGSKIWENYFKNNKYLKSSGKLDKLPENRFAVSWLNKKFLVGVVIVAAVIAYFVVKSFIGFDVSHELTLEGFNKERIVVTTSTYSITGNINPTYKLTVNEQPVYPETNGDFQTQIELGSGFNNVTFRVEGPVGKEDSVTHQVYYQIDESETETSTTTSAGDQTENNPDSSINPDIGTTTESQF